MISVPPCFRSSGVLKHRVTEVTENLELEFHARISAVRRPSQHALDDTSIESLAQLTALEHLRLRDSPITDVGIAKLDPRKLPNLRIINLPQSSLTAAGLEHLASFPHLIQLRLSAIQLDDRAAEVLATFPALRSLHLIGPRFTDAALDQLAKAPKLSSLYIDDCHLSDAAWERLFKVKRSIHVHIDQHHHDRDPNADH